MVIDGNVELYEPALHGTDAYEEHIDGKDNGR
jgi:hypothetical protein